MQSLIRHCGITLQKPYSHGTCITWGHHVIKKWAPDVSVSCCTFAQDKWCLYITPIYWRCFPDMMSRLHIISSNEPSRICTQNAVETLIYNSHCSLYISRLKQRKKTEPANHRNAIRTGPISSHDVCVCWNTAGNLPWNFYFTNCRHGQIAQD